MNGSSSYAVPVPNASLLLSFRPTGRKVLVLGTKRLAASRILSILEADAIPIVVDTDCSNSASSQINDEVQWRISQGQCQFLKAPSDDTEEAWRSLIESVDQESRELFAVCITDTLHLDDNDGPTNRAVKEGKASNGMKQSTLARAEMLHSVCRSKRIPINVADQPHLCDYSFPATHRFSADRSPLLASDAGECAATPTSSSLQIAVTTNGKGCRLAGRIRREIVSKLPRNVGDAVERVGEMREIAKSKRRTHAVESVSNNGTKQRPQSLRRDAMKGKKRRQEGESTLQSAGIEELTEDDLSFDSTPLNSPVPQLSNGSAYGEWFFAAVDDRLESEQDEAEERKRRMRWVAQMSEYWPIDYLGSLSAADMAKALDTYIDEKKDLPSNGEHNESSRGRSRNTFAEADTESSGNTPSTKRASSQHSLALDRPLRERDDRGHIFLVGSGTGHPGLLTTFAHNLLTSSETDLILSDKLVPSSILSLIPKSTPLQIARKFPGNAEGAQSELISLALQGALQGKRVIRLKQGDPFVYGRGGEEVLAFKKAGVHVTVVPGISSALAAPLMLGIPVTQRGAADSLTLCTGVGRGGKSVRLPGYERSRSLIVLMGVARLKDVVKTLCHGWQSASPEGNVGNGGEAPAGTRLGAPFPPFTPIAIIERASSSDQRLVASTLDGIENALARSGEQRPPGMMLIGWAALSLSGPAGHVDVLDDEDECGSELLELERRDLARVDRWLGKKGFLLKEGLDDFYSRYSSIWEHGSLQQSADTVDDTALPTHVNVEGKGASGWAAPRYGEEGPQGGWGRGEKVFH